MRLTPPGAAALLLLLLLPPAGTAGEFAVTPTEVEETKAVFGQVDSRDAVSGPRPDRRHGPRDPGRRGQRGPGRRRRRGHRRRQARPPAAGARRAGPGAELAAGQRPDSNSIAPSSCCKGGNTTQSRVDQARTAGRRAHQPARRRRGGSRRHRRRSRPRATSSRRPPAACSRVPRHRGSVVLPGEEIAMIAGGGYFLRLALPERHAGEIVEGVDRRRVGGRPGAAAEAMPRRTRPARQGLPGDRGRPGARRRRGRWPRRLFRR